MDLISGAVARALVMMDDASRKIGLKLVEAPLGSTLTVSALNNLGGEAVDEIDVDYAGPERNVSFNGDYLREALGRVTTENVIVRMTNDERGPIKIEEDGATDWLCLVMPQTA